MSEICDRCGLKDDNLLDLDTGGTCHREPSHCIAALNDKLKHIFRMNDLLSAKLISEYRRGLTKAGFIAKNQSCKQECCCDVIAETIFKEREKTT